MMIHLWLLSFQGVPRRDKSQHAECQCKRVHQVMEVSSFKWLLRPTCALWSPGCFMQRGPQNQTQFFVFERFETYKRKESLFLHDNRHWVTPHTFSSVRKKCWPWYSLCTRNIVRNQSKEKQDDTLKNPLGLFVSVFPSVEKGLHTADKLTAGLLTYHFLVGNLNHQKIIPKQHQQRNKGSC